MAVDPIWVKSAPNNTSTFSVAQDPALPLDEYVKAEIAKQLPAAIHKYLEDNLQLVYSEGSLDLSLKLSGDDDTTVNLGEPIDGHDIKQIVAKWE